MLPCGHTYEDVALGKNMIQIQLGSYCVQYQDAAWVARLSQNLKQKINCKISCELIKPRIEAKVIIFSVVLLCF